MYSVFIVLVIYNFRHCLASLANIAGMVRKPPCKKLRKIKLSEYGSGVNKRLFYILQTNIINDNIYGQPFYLDL